MWMYQGPSCPDRPSSEELSAAEVEAQIHRVLDLGVKPTLGAGPVPLWRGISSVRISTLGPVSVAFVILAFHCGCDLAQGLGGGPGEPPVRKHGSGRRERVRSTHRGMGSERWGTETSHRFAPSRKGEVEYGTTLPPLSPPRMATSRHRDVVPPQIGSTAGECRSKYPRA
jgi:hypothetical protein